MGKTITIELTDDEALVLSDAIHEKLQTSNGGGEPSSHLNAIEIVLSTVECQLEKALCELFDAQYKELVAKAKSRLGNKV